MFLWLITTRSSLHQSLRHVLKEPGFQDLFGLVSCVKKNTPQLNGTIFYVWLLGAQWHKRSLTGSVLIHTHSGLPVVVFDTNFCYFLFILNSTCHGLLIDSVRWFKYWAELVNLFISKSQKASAQCGKQSFFNNFQQYCTVFIIRTTFLWHINILQRCDRLNTQI